LVWLSGVRVTLQRVVIDRTGEEKRKDGDQRSLVIGPVRAKNPEWLE